MRISESSDVFQTSKFQKPKLQSAKRMKMENGLAFTDDIKPWKPKGIVIIS
jgi:hypothetical protein